MINSTKQRAVELALQLPDNSVTNNQPNNGNYLLGPHSVTVKKDVNKILEDAEKIFQFIKQ